MFADTLKTTLKEFELGSLNKTQAEEIIIEAFKESHKKAALIIAKGRRMREMQKEYFKSRRQSVLEQSKRLESDFDILLLPEKEEKQSDLFNS